MFASSNIWYPPPQKQKLREDNEILQIASGLHFEKIVKQIVFASFAGGNIGRSWWRFGGSCIANVAIVIVRLILSRVRSFSITFLYRTFRFGWSADTVSFILNGCKWYGVDITSVQFYVIHSIFYSICYYKDSFRIPTIHWPSRFMPALRHFWKRQKRQALRWSEEDSINRRIKSRGTTAYFCR